jgi:hypothetical protein
MPYDATTLEALDKGVDRFLSIQGSVAHGANPRLANRFSGLAIAVATSSLPRGRRGGAGRPSANRSGDSRSGNRSSREPAGAPGVGGDAAPAAAAARAPGADGSRGRRKARNRSAAAADQPVGPAAPAAEPAAPAAAGDPAAGIEQPPALPCDAAEPAAAAAVAGAAAAADGEDVIMAGNPNDPSTATLPAGAPAPGEPQPTGLPAVAPRVFAAGGPAPDAARADAASSRRGRVREHEQLRSRVASLEAAVASLAAQLAAAGLAPAPMACGAKRPRHAVSLAGAPAPDVGGPAAGAAAACEDDALRDAGDVAGHVVDAA